MNTDIRISVSLTQHPKVLLLMRRLGDRSFFNLIRLWTWAGVNRPDGDLSGLDAEQIELAADWAGELGTFTQALCDLRLLDKDTDAYRLHDWAEHNPWAAETNARSDAGRFSRLVQMFPREAAKLKAQGMSACTRSEYDSLLKQFKSGQPLGQPLREPLRVPLADSRPTPGDSRPTPGQPLGYSPAPAPSPTPSPTPTPKEQTPVSKPEVFDVCALSEKGKAGAKPCPQAEIVAAYHDILPNLPKVRVWSGENEKNLRARWNEDQARQNLEWWRTLFREIAATPFLVGQKTDFRASLGWSVKPQNFAKIVNGQYPRQGAAPSAARIPNPLAAV